MVGEMSSHFPIENDELISNTLNALKAITRFVFYSAVFIIDARDANSLFTTGVRLMRTLFLEPILPRVMEAVLLSTRVMDIAALEPQRELLTIIMGCGYGGVTFFKRD